jgi:hypothetical protein
MNTSAVPGRSLRRTSRPISYTERAESDQSLDSGFVHEGDYSTNQYTENFEHVPSSPGSPESSVADNSLLHPLDESGIARKRVRQACDFCRRKKCKVHQITNCAAIANLRVVYWQCSL